MSSVRRSQRKDESESAKECIPVQPVRRKWWHVEPVCESLWRGYKNCQKRDHRSHRENRFQKRDAPQKGHGKDRDADKHKTYSKLFDMLILADCHKNNLLKRGFTEEQIVENGYKSTPVYGFRNLTKRLIEEGCTVEGVPGFYKDKDGEWTVYFNRKSSGFMIPVRNIYGLITGVQIRLDHPYEGRKYIWLSSVNFEKGTTSGSPVHFVGNPGEKTVFVTEGPLKGDLAHALSGRTFLCVPGVNQSLNLLPVLKEMKNQGTTFVYEAYDMDKLLATACHGDYSEKCRECPCINKDWKHEKIPCSKKQIKRDNIDKGCNKLAQICKEVGLTGKTLTWDTDAEGNWAENVKGVDDYLVSLQQKKLEE